MPPRGARSQRLGLDPTAPPKGKKLVFSADAGGKDIEDIPFDDAPLANEKGQQLVHADDSADDDDDDDDEAPVEESNVKGKQAFQDEQKRKKEEQARIKEKRARAAAQRQEAAEARKKREAEEAAKRAEEAGEEQEEEPEEGDEDPKESEEESDEEDQEEEEEEEDNDDAELDGASDLPSEDDLDADLDEPSSDEEAATSATTPSSRATRLDPALFAAAFARRAEKEGTSLGSISSATPSFSSSPSFSATATSKRRRGGVAKGRDGMAMKRLKDGRTVVRALDESRQPPRGEEDGEEGEERISLPSRDPSALPNAKARAFKKRRLGLGTTPSSDPKVSANGAKQKKKKKDEHDPLGLEDPAFLPGGELYGLGLGLEGAGKGLTGKPRRRGKGEKRGGDAGGANGGTGRGRRGEGGRVEARKAMASFGRSSAAPAFGFASSA